MLCVITSPRLEQSANYNATYCDERIFKTVNTTTVLSKTAI